MPEKAANPDLKTTAEIQTFLAPHSPSIQAVALKVRQFVLAVVPGAIEQHDCQPG